MAKMGFDLGGIGYGGVSIGDICLAFEVNGAGALYRAHPFGAGSSVCNAYLADVTNDLTSTGAADDTILLNLEGRTIGFTLKGSFLVSSPCPLNFKVFNAPGSTAIFQIDRIPKVFGLLLGDINVIATLNREDLSIQENRFHYNGLLGYDLYRSVGSPVPVGGGPPTG